MKIVYEKNNGKIVAILDNWQHKEVYFIDYPEHFTNNLSEILVDNLPEDVYDGNYKVSNGELIKFTAEEINDIVIYGKVLTEEERQLNKLKPSPDEVQKAENTIEILSLLQEVGI